MEHKQYKLLWMGRELGPYTLEEIKSSLAKDQIGLSHMIENASGDWVLLEDFLAEQKNQPAEPSAAGGEAGPVRYYLAIGAKPAGPYVEKEVCEFIESGSVIVSTQIMIEGSNTWQKVTDFPVFIESMNIFLSSNAEKTPDKTEVFEDEGPKNITVFFQGQQYGPYSVAEIRHAAKTGTIDGNAPASRPGMPGMLALHKWSDFKGVNFQYRSDTVVVDDTTSSGLVDADSVKQGYIYAGLSLVCCAPLAIGGLIYGIKNIGGPSNMHGIIQIVLSVIALGIWIGACVAYR